MNMYVYIYVYMYVYIYIYVCIVDEHWLMIGWFLFSFLSYQNCGCDQQKNMRIFHDKRVRFQKWKDEISGSQFPTPQKI